MNEGESKKAKKSSGRARIFRAYLNLPWELLEREGLVACAWFLEPSRVPTWAWPLHWLERLRAHPVHCPVANLTTADRGVLVHPLRQSMAQSMTSHGRRWLGTGV